MAILKRLGLRLPSLVTAQEWAADASTACIQRAYSNDLSSSTGCHRLPRALDRAKPERFAMLALPDADGYRMLDITGKFAPYTKWRGRSKLLRAALDIQPLMEALLGDSDALKLQRRRFFDRWRELDPSSQTQRKDYAALEAGESHALQLFGPAPTGESVPVAGTHKPGVQSLHVMCFLLVCWVWWVGWCSSFFFFSCVL